MPEPLVMDKPASGGGAPVGAAAKKKKSKKEPKEVVPPPPPAFLPPPGGLPPYQHLNIASVPYEHLNPDDRAQRDQADARQYKRAEKMHDMVHKFLMMHVGCVGDKVKELDTWRIFLEDLDRKVNILHWIRTDDIWRAVATLPENDKLALASCYATLTDKFFPKNFDEKLTYLRRVVGFAAAGNQYRLQSTSTSTKSSEAPGEGEEAKPVNIATLGLTTSELRQQGYLVGEMLEAGYSPMDLLEAGYSIPQLKAHGLTVSQLLSCGCQANTEFIKILKNAGYTLFELAITDVFSADQLLYAGYSKSDIRKAGLDYNYPPRHMRRNQGGSEPHATERGLQGRHSSGSRAGGRIESIHALGGARTTYSPKASRSGSPTLAQGGASPLASRPPSATGTRLGSTLSRVPSSNSVAHHGTEASAEGGPL